MQVPELIILLETVKPEPPVKLIPNELEPEPVLIVFSKIENPFGVAKLAVTPIELHAGQLLAVIIFLLSVTVPLTVLLGKNPLLLVVDIPASMSQFVTMISPVLVEPL